MNFSLLKHVFHAFNEDKVMRLASSIAFSAILSLAPLFIVLIALIGWVLGLQNGGHGHHVAQSLLLGQVSKFVGKSAADTIQQLIDSSFNKPRLNLIAQIFGWAGFISGAAGLFSSLQDSLNTIWHIEAIGGSWKQMVRDRVASFLMIVVVSCLLTGTAMASAIGAHFQSQIPFFANPVITGITSQSINLLLVIVAFALIYKVLPDVRIAWRDIWFGAVVTALLFVIGEALISIYLAKIGGASVYGAAGSLLVALLWIYYSAIILLLGAEVTKVAAGHAETIAPSSIRILSDQPAGIDPRSPLRHDHGEDSRA